MRLDRSALDRLAAEWQEEARRHRVIAESDPVAATLDHCAKTLVRCLGQMDARGEDQTTEEYAKAHEISAQTVRNRCAAGRIPGAYRDGRGAWRIPAAA